MPEDELRGYLSKGWQAVMKTLSGKIVIEETSILYNVRRIVDRKDIKIDG